RPAVFPIGCSGVMTHVEKLDDGRYNIVLRGLERFRILEEDHERSYRRAVVESLADESPAAEDRAVLMNQRAKLEALLSEVVEKGGGAGAPGGQARSESSASYARTTAAMTDEDLVHALAQYLDL